MTGRSRGARTRSAPRRRQPTRGPSRPVV